MSQMERDGRKVNSFARQEKMKGIDSTCQLRKISLENTNMRSVLNIGITCRHTHTEPLLFYTVNFTDMLVMPLPWIHYYLNKVLVRCRQSVENYGDNLKLNRKIYPL